MSGLASRVSGSVTWSLLGSVSYSVPAWTATISRSGQSRAFVLLAPRRRCDPRCRFAGRCLGERGAGDRTGESVDTLRTRPRLMPRKPLKPHTFIADRGLRLLRFLRPADEPPRSGTRVYRRWVRPAGGF